MTLTDEDRSTLWRALDLEQRFEAGIFPRGAGQASHFRKLERTGLIKFDGFGRDIDSVGGEDVPTYRLTDAGRDKAKEDT